MKKFPLDLSSFKKVSSDKTSTTLRHRDGHEIKLATNALSPKLRGQLASLESSEPKPIMMAKGGEVYPVCENPSCKSYGKPHPNCRCHAGMSEGGEVFDRYCYKDSAHDSKCKYFAKGGEVDSPKQQDDFDRTVDDIGLSNKAAEERLAKDAASMPQTPEQLPPDQALAPAPIVPAEMPPAAEIAPTIQQPVLTPSMPTQQSVAPAAMPTPSPQSAMTGTLQQQEGMLQDAYQKQVQGVQQGAAAEGALGIEQAKVLNDQAIQQRQAQTHYNETFAKLDSERKHLQDDIIQAHIDPAHYLGKMDTVQRVGTAIGLILGGIGSGLTHGDNQALKFLNSQIDRDIEAQKVNLGKKESLLSANMKEFGNLKDATEMTRLMMGDTVSTQLKAAAAKSQDPIAKARALAAAGEIEQKMAPMFQSFAMNRSMINAAEQDRQSGNGTTAQESMLPILRVINPEKAKEIEGRLVPGVGMATIPVTAEVRNTLTAKQTLDTMTKDFYKWTQEHSGAVDPRVVNIGKTKAAELQSLYRNSINGGVFKKGEQEFIDQIVDSDPTKFFNNLRVLPKLKEVLDSNRAQLNILKKANGLPVQNDLTPQQQSFAKWAKENPNDPKSAMILKKLGL